MTIGTISDSRLKTITIMVELTGLTDIMFDRYAGDNSTKLEWSQKVYYKPGTSTICLPTTNITSFLTAHNTNSAPKRLRDKRKYKDICNANLSFCMVQALDGSAFIPFLRDNEPITTGQFESDKDLTSGIYLHRSVARLDKGIPNPKERPVLPLPWSLQFKLVLLPNAEIKESEIYNLFVDGGLAIGLGTYRGVYGKFIVSKWDNGS